MCLVHAKVLPIEGETFSAPETNENCEALIQHFGAETVVKGTIEHTDFAKDIASKTNAQRKTSA